MLFIILITAATKGHTWKRSSNKEGSSIIYATKLGQVGPWQWQIFTQPPQKTFADATLSI